MKKIKIAPILTKELKEQVVHRIEPYLKSGLSINKACLQAGVPKSTLYKVMKENAYLRDRVDRSRQFLSVAISNIVARKVHTILLKQQEGEDIVGEDLDFIKWVALNSTHCREEFGKVSRMALNFDPEAEIMRLNDLIEQHAVDDEYHVTS
jgi:hypothetical protein